MSPTSTAWLARGSWPNMHPFPCKRGRLANARAELHHPVAKWQAIAGAAALRAWSDPITCFIGCSSLCFGTETGWERWASLR
eukprot:scaffold387_cov31-Tisochrysis_lutea.AAC.2